MQLSLFKETGEPQDEAIILVTKVEDLAQSKGSHWSVETYHKVLLVLDTLGVIRRRFHRKYTEIRIPLGKRAIHIPSLLKDLQQLYDTYTNRKVRLFAKKVAKRLQMDEFVTRMSAISVGSAAEQAPLLQMPVQGDAQRIDTYSGEKTLDTYQGKQLILVTGIEASQDPGNKGESVPRGEVISTRPEQRHPRRSEARVIQFHNRRAEMVALPATLTLAEWKTTLEYFHYKCADFQINDYQVFEHFIPLTSGGGTTRHNCVPACGSINSIKGDQHPATLPSSSWIAGTLPRVQKYLKTRETGKEADS
jgi:5-methylcytosine-specific restriction endonuclease McrA